MTFDDILAAVKAKALDAAPLGTALKFDLDGDFIHIDGCGDDNTVTTEDKEADSVISISKANLEKLMNGDLNPMTAFMMGKVKVKGDMGAAMKLQSFL